MCSAVYTYRCSRYTYVVRQRRAMCRLCSVAALSRPLLAVAAMAAVTSALLHPPLSAVSTTSTVTSPVTDNTTSSRRKYTPAGRLPRDSTTNRKDKSAGTVATTITYNKTQKLVGNDTTSEGNTAMLRSGGESEHSFNLDEENSTIDLGSSPATRNTLPAWFSTTICTAGAAVNHTLQALTAELETTTPDEPELETQFTTSENLLVDHSSVPSSPQPPPPTTTRPYYAPPSPSLVAFYVDDP